jgi:hypothetical protein
MTCRLFPAFAAFAAAFAIAILAVPAAGQIPGISLPGGALSAGGPVKSMLERASDETLDKLAEPGAFSADSAIRIGLPGGLGGMMKMSNGTGIADSLNTAAGQAAGAAKPIFRAAIDRISAQDALAIAKGGNTGATDYLRRSAGAEITAQLMPLVHAALDRTGILSQASQLSFLGMNANTLIDYVTQKTADGIFTYMGRKETGLRQNPSALLKGF